MGVRNVIKGTCKELRRLVNVERYARAQATLKKFNVDGSLKKAVKSKDE